MSSTFWAKTSRLPVWSSWIITLRSGNLARTRGPSDDPSPVRGSPTHTHAECTTAASLVYGSYLTLTTFKSTSQVSKVYQPTRAASPRSTRTLHHPSHTSTLRSPHTRAPPMKSFSLSAGWAFPSPKSSGMALASSSLLLSQMSMISAPGGIRWEHERATAATRALSQAVLAVRT